MLRPISNSGDCRPNLLKMGILQGKINYEQTYIAKLILSIYKTFILLGFLLLYCMLPDALQLPVINHFLNCFQNEW